MKQSRTWLLMLLLVILAPLQHKIYIFLQVIDVSGLLEIHLCYDFLLLVNAIDGAETHFPW